jgi:hypothetical protein
MKLQFRANLDGYIAEVLLPLEPSVDMISFEKQPDKRLSDAAYLEKFAGNYELGGDTISINHSGDRLLLSIPGQPQYILVPALGNKFKIKDYAVVSVSFKMNEQNKPEAVILDQPNGRFEAKRVDE